MKTLRISDDVHRKPTRLLGQMMAQSGKAKDNVGGVKAKLVVALHPSGQNRLARTFNKKIAELVIRSFN